MIASAPFKTDSASVNVYNEICKDKMENILFTTDYKEKEGYIVYTSSDGTIKSITLVLFLLIFSHSSSFLPPSETRNNIYGFTIPSYIKTIVPEYKIYLRYISAMPTRIMMIAACE